MIHNSLYAFLAIVLLSCCSPTATCQQHKWKTYSHKELGIQIRYRNADDFDDRKELLSSPSQWRDTALFTGMVHLKLPAGFYVKAERANRNWYNPKCDNSVIGDTAILITQGDADSSDRPEAITLYSTSADFRHIAFNENFVLLDTSFRELDFKEADSSDVAQAIRFNRWASLGRQGMTEKATFLSGTFWQGLRGSNFTGYYDEKGYAGLQRCSAAFLVHKITEGCYLVCSYSDSQMEANKLGEADFYDIVSTIEIRREP